MNPFIYPHQFNYIRSQLSQLVQTVYFVGDYRVYAAQKAAVRNSVVSLFPNLSETESILFQGLEDIRGKSEIHEFMDTLKPYVIPFPALTTDDLRRLFRKVKKLPLPDLNGTDWSNFSYFGWRDVATKSIYLVSWHNGELTGIRCSYVPTPGNRISTCCVCKTGGSQVGLVVAVTKTSNYKSVGNHMCLDTEACNANMRSTDGLDAFVSQALNTR